MCINLLHVTLLINDTGIPGCPPHYSGLDMLGRLAQTGTPFKLFSTINCWSLKYSQAAAIENTWWDVVFIPYTRYAILFSLHCCYLCVTGLDLNSSGLFGPPPVNPSINILRPQVGPSPAMSHRVSSPVPHQTVKPKPEPSRREASSDRHGASSSSSGHSHRTSVDVKSEHNANRHRLISFATQLHNYVIYSWQQLISRIFKFLYFKNLNSKLNHMPYVGRK